MLAPAQLYEDELDKRIKSVWYEEKYKYWNCGIYYESALIEKNTWHRHDFVSLGWTGEVIGRISYQIDRSSNMAQHLEIINFTNNIGTFGADLKNAIDDIFVKFGMRKLSYAVVVGNPIEKSYDRLTAKYGGRIIGICKDEIRLIDGKLYDYKMYEIFQDDYIKNRRR